jgi:HEAT repeat protein
MTAELLTLPYDHVGTLLVADRLFSPGAADTPEETAAALRSDDWMLRLTALHAIRRHPDPALAPRVISLLCEQNALPLYGQDRPIAYDQGFVSHDFDTAFADVPAETIKCWRFRWRLKQAACLALGEIAAASGAETLPGEALALLCALATSTADDHPVRAAACHALGYFDGPQVREALREAAEDEEWCTRCEARKSLARLESTPPGQISP